MKDKHFNGNIVTEESHTTGKHMAEEKVTDMYYDDEEDTYKPVVEIPQELKDKIKCHSEICDYLKNLYATKNADYGDSMHPLFEEYGLTAFLVLFGIKIQRIKSLNEKHSANYESLEDSLLDLANYALIAVTEMRSDKSVKEANQYKEFLKNKEIYEE